MKNTEYFERMYKLRGTEIKQLIQSYGNQIERLKEQNRKKAVEIYKLKEEKHQWAKNMKEVFHDKQNA